MRNKIFIIVLITYKSIVSFANSSNWGLSAYGGLNFCAPITASGGTKLFTAYPNFQLKLNHQFNKKSGLGIGGLFFNDAYIHDVENGIGLQTFPNNFYYEKVQIHKLLFMIHYHYSFSKIPY
ncbi:MAG: hypothetical protein IPK03_01960 [Bacteroidetes bacterium]|nr:hypothetical protein [Bacteroidota bacterium]